MTAPGWYHAEGDPVNTTRYWDGAMWVGEPVANPDASGASAAPASGGFTSVDGAGPANLNLASTGSRIGARFIDIVIGLVILLILIFPFISALLDGFDALGPNPTGEQIERVVEDALEEAGSTRFLIFAVVSVLWDFIWVGLFGATPGKLILGLRVANRDNGTTPPGWGAAALRSLNRLVGFIPGIGSIITLLIGLVSLIMLFVDEKNRTVMDFAAKTLVIKK